MSKKPSKKDLKYSPSGNACAKSYNNAISDYDIYIKGLEKELARIIGSENWGLTPYGCSKIAKAIISKIIEEERI